MSSIKVIDALIKKNNLDLGYDIYFRSEDAVPYDGPQYHEEAGDDNCQICHSLFKKHELIKTQSQFRGVHTWCFLRKSKISRRDKKIAKRNRFASDKDIINLLKTEKEKTDS